MTQDKEHLVYAIGTSGHTMVKIGTTTNLEGRRAGLQTSSPFLLHVLWQHPGGHELERFLHASFKGRRSHGEWFDFAGADPVAEINRATAAYAARPVRKPKTMAPPRIATLPPHPEVDGLLAEIRSAARPERRGALATDTLTAIKELNAEVAQIRQAAAKELKDDGLTLKEIGERFGSEGKPLHYTRIQQILKGKPTGRWARVARDSAKDNTPENGDPS